MVVWAPYDGCWLREQRAWRAGVREGAEALHAASRSAAVASVPVLTRLCETPAAGEVARTNLHIFEGKTLFLPPAEPAVTAWSGWEVC
jgi:hypothetical protein